MPDNNSGWVSDNPNSGWVSDKPSFLHRAEDYLPYAGMLAGGVLGSVEPGGGNVAGAALGGMAGESLREGLQKRYEPNQIGGAGVTGAATEMGSQIIGKVAGPVLRGIRNVISPRLSPPPTVPTTAFAPPPESGVMTVPEPRTALPSEKPGFQYSIPREQLPEQAQRGTPGAGDVLKQQQPILYSPKEGTGYPSPRSVQSVGEITPDVKAVQSEAKRLGLASIAAIPATKAQKIATAIRGPRYRDLADDEKADYLRDLLGRPGLKKPPTSQ